MWHGLIVARYAEVDLVLSRRNGVLGKQTWRLMKRLPRVERIRIAIIYFIQTFPIDVRQARAQSERYKFEFQNAPPRV